MASSTVERVSHNPTLLVVELSGSSTIGYELRCATEGCSVGEMGFQAGFFFFGLLWWLTVGCVGVWAIVWLCRVTECRLLAMLWLATDGWWLVVPMLGWF